jgi:hypothetical protein
MVSVDPNPAEVKVGFHRYLVLTHLLPPSRKAEARYSASALLLVFLDTSPMLAPLKQNDARMSISAPLAPIHPV